MITGLELFNSWTVYRAIFSIFVALSYFSGLMFIGGVLSSILNKEKLTYKYVENGLSLGIAIALITLLFFTSAFFGTLNVFYVVIAICFIGFYIIVSNAASVLKTLLQDKNKKFTIFIFILIFLCIFLFALSSLPTTKIDELVYHLLVPLRIVQDGSLNPYALPWEASLLPQLIYQISFFPFFQMGLPEVPGVFSLILFLYSIYISYKFLVNEGVDKKTAFMFSASLYLSGLYVVVDVITIASSALSVFYMTMLIISLLNITQKTQNGFTNINTLTFGVACFGVLISKVTMAPFIVFIIFYFIYRLRNFLITNGVMFGHIVRGIFLPTFSYLFVIFITYLVYKSPFGAMFGVFFESPHVIFDPFVEGAGKDVKLKDTLFLSVTKFNPIIWISVLIAPFMLNDIKLRIVFILFIFQFIVIFLLLPEKPRHFQGLQYFIAIVTFLAIYSRYKYLHVFLRRASLGVFYIYTVLILYYGYPIFNTGFNEGIQSFGEKYIPYYQDFNNLNQKLLESDKLVFHGSRVNLYHSPRKASIYPEGYRDCNSYLFNIDSPGLPVSNSLSFYKNSNAVQFTYRTPGLSPKITSINVYKPNNNCKTKP
jgi:hypothetical protein